MSPWLPRDRIELMLLCGTCHSKRLPCQGDDKKVPFGKCEICGRSDARVSCKYRTEPIQRTQVAIYRSTDWLEYRRPKKK